MESVLTNVAAAKTWLVARASETGSFLYEHRPSKLMVLGAAGVLTASIAALVASSPHLRRMLRIYKFAIPMLIQYKMEIRRVERKHYATEDEQKAAMAKLHAYWAPRCYEILVDLGGIFIKSGQVYGARADFLPQEYIVALAPLQDKAPSRPWEVMKESLEESLGPIEALFESVSHEPLGSASIAQVHRARLLDGTDVVIKLQYPHAYEIMKGDLAVQRRLVGMAQKEVVPFMDELSKQLLLEFDFAREAAVQARIATNLGAEFSDIVVPRVVSCTGSPPRTLVAREAFCMEYVDGQPIKHALGALPLERQQHLLETIVDAYGKMVLEDGIFHGDPHPGNFFLLRDGRIGLLDFGQVQEFAEEHRFDLCRLISAAGAGNWEKAVAIWQKFGWKTKSGSFESARTALDLFLDTAPCPDFGTKFHTAFNVNDQVLAYPAPLTIALRVCMLLRGTLSLFPAHSISNVQRWKARADRVLAAAEADV